MMGAKGLTREQVINLRNPVISNLRSAALNYWNWVQDRVSLAGLL